MLNGVGPGAADNPREVTVMSQNLYVGSEMISAMGAIMSGDPNQIIPAVTQLWANVLATNFPERAQALAREIDTAQPELIGLQEVSLFRSGPGLDPAPAEDVELDYLQILVGALESRGLHYAPVAVTTDFDVEVPGFNPQSQLKDVRLTDRDVILARTDLPPWQMSLENVQQEQHFVNNVHIPPPDGPFTLLRGWNSVDVQVCGQEFRLINAHVESPDNPYFAAIQLAQAGEINAMSEGVSMPVVVIGDYNSPAERPDSQPYQVIVSAGMTDAWTATHPGDPGYTWGNEPDLLNADPLPLDPQRIDLVLYRGDVKARSMDRVGISQSDRTPSGLWPSDHAGVVATLAIHVAANGSELPWAVVNDDPMRPGETAAFVVGTWAADRVMVNPRANGDLAVTLAPSPQPTILHPSASGRVYVVTGGGNDCVAVAPGVRRDTVIDAGDGNDVVFGGAGNDLIYGGAGNDLLFGGAGNDVLLGGHGNDMLFGGNGNDLLIGGRGNDLLFGESGDDILIGGSTALDANAAALWAVMSEWNARRPMSARIANLESGGGLNGSWRLGKASSVQDDASRDVLFSGPGDDWFLAFASDVVADQGRRDRVS
jgi:endonuclease/exonuclease/phosphatase family metal-dependent hydrolase